MLQWIYKVDVHKYQQIDYLINVIDYARLNYLERVDAKRDKSTFDINFTFIDYHVLFLPIELESSLEKITRKVLLELLL